MNATAANITDRAHRYRAQQNAPDSPRICAFCGSKRNVEVEHIDGHEENGAPDNLLWACRKCNTRKGYAMKKAGIGRLTHQYNPKNPGATTLGEWMNAVGAITPHKGKKYAGSKYGLTSTMTVQEAVAIIRATPQSKRAEFAAQLHRKNPVKVKSAAKQLLDVTDAVMDGTWEVTGGLPQQILHKIVNGKRNAEPRYQIYDLQDGNWQPISSVQAYSPKGAVAVYRQQHAEWSKGRKLKAVLVNRNPSNAAAQMYEAFHGKPATKELRITEEVHEHEHLAPLGVLVNFKVRTLTGYDATVGVAQEDAEANDFDETIAKPETVYLASNEDGTQLYFVGGDQSLDLSRFKMDSDKWQKDDMIVGVLYEVTYRTKKKFDKFQLTDYFHHLGEETGVQPLLRYEPLSPHLYVTGGQYKIEIPAFGVSPGIEN